MSDMDDLKRAYPLLDMVDRATRYDIVNVCTNVYLLSYEIKSVFTTHWKANPTTSNTPLILFLLPLFRLVMLLKNSHQWKVYYCCIMDLKC